LAWGKGSVKCFRKKKCAYREQYQDASQENSDTISLFYGINPSAGNVLETLLRGVKKFQFTTTPL
jgi:hypothetical protein